MSNLIKLVFLRGGDKGCISDKHRITKGKEHRGTARVWWTVSRESSCTAASQTSAPTALIHRYFLRQFINLHLICFCCPDFAILLPEWANHLKPSNIVGALKTAFFPPCPLSCISQSRHLLLQAHSTRPHHDLLNFPVTDRLKSLLWYKPTTLFFHISTGWFRLEGTLKPT